MNTQTPKTQTTKPLCDSTKVKKPIQTLQEFSRNLRNDCFYFVCPSSAGETYQLCLMEPALKQKYKGRIVFIVKPTQIAICEMFKGLEYIVCESKSVDYCIDRQCLLMNNVVSVPTLGKIYSHCLFWNEIYENNRLDFDRIRLMLPSNAQRVLPTNLPKISTKLQAKLDTIAPLNKIILLCPEANSFPKLPFAIFIYELESLRKQGYSVIVNILKCKQEWTRFFIEGVYDLDLSLKDAIALGINCAGVVSTCSGFCDIVQPHCKHLKIYYTAFSEYILSNNILWNTSFEQVYIYDVPIYKAFMSFIPLPLKLYQRYIAKGFLKRMRTPFTVYFKIYKKYKANDNAKQNLVQDFGINEAEFESIFSEIKNTYEYQIGLLLQKACKGFWRGGFVWFVFNYLKLRKRKKTLTRLGEFLW